ncbi:AP endonuclease, family 2 [Sesbania bispinosa]|nr:AP endonuclease, family 2 [Sesbania bispinosa]
MAKNGNGNVNGSPRNGLASIQTRWQRMGMTTLTGVQGTDLQAFKRIKSTTRFATMIVVRR